MRCSWTVLMLAAQAFPLCSPFMLDWAPVLLPTPSSAASRPFQATPAVARTECLRHSSWNPPKKSLVGSRGLRCSTDVRSNVRLRGGGEESGSEKPIDFYFWPVPCGWKVAIMLEELGSAYKLCPINILQGEQFDAEYLQLNPNNKVPTIVDPNGPEDAPFSVFESGAILLYLGEKAGGRFLGGPAGSAARHNVTQWLMFQMGSIGPMFGQNGYFNRYARGSDEELRHGRERYSSETHRLYRVMDKRLSSAPFLGGEAYSVADMAVFPWIQPEMHGVDLSQYPHVLRWFEGIRERPAVQRAYSLLEEDCKIGDRSDATHQNLFERQREVGREQAAQEGGGGGGSGLEEGGGAAGREDGGGEGALELWFTPIANHVHCVEAVARHCRLHRRLRLCPTDPFQVDEAKGRLGFKTLPSANPLLTVPALKTPDGEAVYGGPVIYEYLNSLRAEGVPSLFPEADAAPAEAMRVRRNLWLADGLFDTFVEVLLEAGVGDAQRRDEEIARKWRKIVQSLDALEQCAQAEWGGRTGQSDFKLDIAQVRAACTLDFIAARPAVAAMAGGGEGFDWREGREALAAWYGHVRERDLFRRLSLESVSAAESSK